ncbi:MAG: DUF5674 family protein [Elusimicrobiota bacterium]
MEKSNQAPGQVSYDGGMESIKILREKVDPQKIKELAESVFADMIKIVADVDREILAAGGELHADAEALLLEDGSKQDNLWGANFFPWKEPFRRLQYTALINIRPGADNAGMLIQNPDIRRKVQSIVEKLLLATHEKMA